MAGGGKVGAGAKAVRAAKAGGLSCEHAAPALGVLMAVCVSTYFHGVCRQEDWSVFPRQPPRLEWWCQRRRRTEGCVDRDEQHRPTSRSRS